MTTANEFSLIIALVFVFQESYSRLTRALRRRLRILENSAQHRRQLVSGQGTHEHPGFHIVLHLPHYQR